MATKMKQIVHQDGKTCRASPTRQIRIIGCWSEEASSSRKQPAFENTQRAKSKSGISPIRCGAILLSQFEWRPNPILSSRQPLSQRRRDSASDNQIITKKEPRITHHRLQTDPSKKIKIVSNHQSTENENNNGHARRPAADFCLDFMFVYGNEDEHKVS